MSALRLLEDIQEQIVCTNNTQIQVDEMISRVEALMSMAQTDINEVLLKALIYATHQKCVVQVFFA